MLSPRRPLAVLALLAVSITAVFTQAQPQYRAQIRRTSYGIPHITAADYGSLGFGEGYAFAQDHACTLADQVIKVRGERARFFGAGENNRHVNSDIAMKALDIYAIAKQLLESLPPDERAQIEGYAAGYNQYLKEVTTNGLGGWCKGKEWVFELSAIDILAYNQSVVMTTTNFADMIATAVPPRGETAMTRDVQMPEFELASNGWAIGKDRSANGRGMLVANPHYPWTGANRFWEKHLIIPGKLNVYGVGLLGSPGVAIGFNQNVAWTHTVSAGKRFTLYTLNLVPGSPTRYLYDGQQKEMTSKVVRVDVRQGDGSLKSVEQRVFFSHYGPIVNLPGFGWSAKRAVAIKDANGNNMQFYNQRFAMNAAKNLDEFKAAHAKYNSIPWINTIATSSDGRAWYADTSATPNLKPEAITALMKKKDSDPLTKLAWDRGLVLLDGSDSLYEWVSDPSTRPGVIPWSRMPQLERKDYVFNANDSFWLANPHQLLTGYSPLQGLEGTPRSLRTRMNAILLEDTSAQGPAGKDGKFNLDELAAAVLSNRSLSSELLRADVVKKAQANPKVTVDGQTVDLTSAAKILAAWDGRFDTGSVGAVLWREFLTQYDQVDTLRKGNLFSVDFNPADSVNTPSTLAAEKANDVLVRLAKAVKVLEQAGFGIDAPLGKVQFSDKNGGRIPIHGGDGPYDGIANVVSYSAARTTLEPGASPAKVQGSRYLSKDGYLINYGSSFLMAMEYTDKGPHAQAFLTYSESGDPASPHFYDQTELFSAKKWRPILFSEADIKADKNLKVVNVSNSSRKSEAKK